MSDYTERNRAHWTVANARFTDRQAPRAWDQTEITWGAWQQPEATVQALPDVAGLDVIELGCGTGYFGSWLKRRGARGVVGVDITPAQLATARRLNDETGLGLEFIEANAEAVPLPDNSFDFALSEYGASIWCDPYRWIPEAARLLRPGGELVFLVNSTLSTLCSPDQGSSLTEQLQRPQRGLHRLDWNDPGEEPSVEFALGHGDMFRLLHATGFDVVNLIELYADEDSVDHEYYSFTPAEWAKRWPAEEIWRARLRA